MSDLENKETQENALSEVQLIGKSSNHIKIGIIGLPNVGKSMLFSAISGKEVPYANFPFSTTDPNIAVCQVTDERFEWLCDVYRPPPTKAIPQRYTLIDTPALVKDSFQGAGLGNAVLASVRTADVLCHVVRAFESSDLTHVERSVDPLRDLDIVQRELIEKDKELVTAGLALLERSVDMSVGGAHVRFEFDTLVKVRDLLFGGSYAAEREERLNKTRGRNKTKTAQILALRAGPFDPKTFVPTPIREAQWSPDECDVLCRHQFYTAKEIVVAVNVSKREVLLHKMLSISDHVGNTSSSIAPLLNQIRDKKYTNVLPISIPFEKEVAQLKRAGEWVSYLAANPMHIPSADELISTCYHALRTIFFYTASRERVCTWTMREESSILQAAAMIHADVERGFICAEVVTAEDVRELREETAMRRGGRVKQQGKRYLVNDGDVLTFQFRSHP